MPPPQSVERSCAYCHESATLTCIGCKGAPVIGDESNHSNSYCSAACQKLDWASHKKLCKNLQARKALYRAGSILQSIFFLYREKVFDLDLTHVVRKEEKIYMFEAKCQKLIVEHDILKEFPSGLFSGKEEIHAALTFQACSEASAWMVDLIQHFIQGLTSDILEFSVMVKNRKLEMVLVDFAGDECSGDLVHTLFKITLEGDKFVLNLAGAQYGHFNTVSPFIDYCESYVSSIRHKDTPAAYYPAGNTQHTMVTYQDKFPPDFRAGIVLNKAVYGILKVATEGWFKTNHITIESMLKLPQKAFGRNVESLVIFIASRLDQTLCELGEEAASVRARVLKGELTSPSLDVEPESEIQDMTFKMGLLSGCNTGEEDAKEEAPTKQES